MIKVKKERTDWGSVFYYYLQNAGFVLYIYDDDKDVVYLSNVFVNDNERHKGIGNEILKIATDEAINLGGKTLYLKCLKTSFVHNWYKRNGFVDDSLDDEDNNYIWMVKKI